MQKLPADDVNRTKRHRTHGAHGFFNHPRVALRLLLTGVRAMRRTNKQKKS